ncbi:MAG: glycosyltransferase [Deltaproteobacteria bacterium]|nr:glycosyltransferase [Deltaproteobacteria bacterium]
MLITIVTPSYNQGGFLEQTITSVLSQGGGFYLEYLVMDGGSTDGSVEIMKKYDRLLKSGAWPVKCLGVQYKWKSEKDNGQADAINKGFRDAKGEIVAWLNADDTYLPGALQRAIGHLSENPGTMMLYGEGYEIDSSGGVIRRFPATREFDLDSLIHVCDYILQPTVFMRKKALDEAGYLDPALHWCLDWDLWIRIGKRFRVDYIDGYLANSRVYGETKTSTGGLKRYREICSVIRRHGSRTLAPGYFVYGFDLMLYALGRVCPSLYGLMKRIFKPRRAVTGGA